MTTLTITVDRLAEIRPGDRIVAIDGRPYDFEVTGALAPIRPGATPGIRLATTSAADRYLYPDAHVAATVTVERPEPVTPAPTVKRRTRRLIDGVTFEHQDGSWYAADRRYEIRYDEAGLTECDNAHPARLTPELVAWAKTVTHTDATIAILDADRRGLRGYRCPGMSEHTYYEWIIWDHKIDDFLGHDTGGYDRFIDAAKTVAGQVLHGGRAE